MKPMKLLGIVLLVAGVALLGVGIYRFVEFRQSLGGKLASGLNRLSNALDGSSTVAEGYVQPIIMMVAGVVSGAAGSFLFKKR